MCSLYCRTVISTSLQNHVRVHGLKEYVVTNIEEVTRVIYVGNSKTQGFAYMYVRI